MSKKSCKRWPLRTVANTSTLARAKTFKRLLEESHEKARKGINEAAHIAASGSNYWVKHAAKGISAACFDARIGTEAAAADSTGPRAKISPESARYVVERLHERHERVRAWRDAVQGSMKRGCRMQSLSPCRSPR